MTFIADFHIHSKYSRATAKTLDLEHIYVAAQIKGITVIGTGDFTHPAWFSEITEKLIPAEPGLYKLKDDLADKCDHEVPDSCKQPVRFILTSEISNIYKKNDKTRKNHNLIFYPDLDSVSQFNKRLGGIGNITSDGRPILGLDAKHLLEIMLEVDDKGFLVPAHIWTPWFSLLGSKSGFNSIEECFEDLSSYIFAAETGLSSDPAMNRRLSALDGITLMSNSDAHSPFNLGREANRFDTELSYFAIKDALKTGNPETFLGTFEFYPEEGKYHFDGHRKCNICYHPKESLKQNGICPVCNKPLTLGVLYRVEELADRKENQKSHGAHDYYSIIPLTDILSDIFLVGPKSKKVTLHFNQAVAELGSEFDILHKRSIADLNAAKIPLLGEAVHRMRTGKIHLSPGYDGEFGKIKIFTAEERDRLMGQKSLFGLSKQNLTPKKTPFNPNLWQTKSSDTTNIAHAPLFHQTPLKENSTSFDVSEDIFTELNDHQKKAVVHDTAPLIISAGPGTGKTKTLTHRIAYLIMERKVAPESILALTFTNKAAEEMKERLMRLLSQTHKLPFVGTFHGFCNDFLSTDLKHKSLPPHTIIDDKVQKRLIKTAIERSEKSNRSNLSVDDVFHYITTAKQFILSSDDELGDTVPQNHLRALVKIYKAYQNLLDFQNLADYEDLIFQTVKRLETDETLNSDLQNRFSHIFVDEYQDLNYGQYRLIKNLRPSGQNLCVIGDPNQAIYGFRGSDPSYFNRFIADFSNAETISLSQNYRSTETILQGSAQIIAAQTTNTHSAEIYSGIKGIDKMGIISSPTEKSEAVAIGKLIEKMVGGIGLHSMDFGLINDLSKTPERSFSDFAVLYRTHNQGRVMADILGKANIPCQIPQKENILLEKGIAELLAIFRLVEGQGSIFDMETVIRLPGSGLGIKTFRTFNDWHFTNRKPLYESLRDIRKIPVKSLSTASQLKLDKWIRQLFQIKDKLKPCSVPEKLEFLSKIPLIKHALDKNPKTKEIFSVLLQWASAHINDSATFCANLNLCHDVDFYDKRVEKVSLLTLHASKGLEFPVVFICGCEEGFIPHGHHHPKTTDDSEERRLFYVAMTRAKEDLYFSWARKRNIYGKTEKRNLSHFVTEIEQKLIRDEATHLPRKKPPGHAQLTLF